jgi:hypothetical protein
MRKYFKNLFGFPVERESDLIGERCRDPSRSGDVVKKTLHWRIFFSTFLRAALHG